MENLAIGPPFMMKRFRLNVFMSKQILFYLNFICICISIIIILRFMKQSYGHSVASYFCIYSGIILSVCPCMFVCLPVCSSLSVHLCLSVCLCLSISVCLYMSVCLCPILTSDKVCRVLGWFGKHITRYLSNHGREGEARILVFYNNVFLHIGI